MEQLAHDLKTRLAAALPAGHCLELLVTYPLDCVQQIEDTLTSLHDWGAGELPKPTQQMLVFYLMAAYCLQASKHKPEEFNSKIAEHWARYLFVLAQSASLNLYTNVEALVQLLSVRIQACTQGKELLGLLNVALALQQKGVCIPQSVAEQGCFRLLESQHHSPKALLAVLKMIQAFDATGILCLDVAKLDGLIRAFAHILEEEAPEPETVAELHKWVNSIELRSDLRPVLAEVRSNAAARLETPRAKFQLTTWEQLNVDKTPVYTVTSVDPQLFVYHASANYQGSTLLFTIKEYVSEDPKQAKLFLREGGRTQRLGRKCLHMLQSYGMFWNSQPMAMQNTDGGSRYGGKHYLSVVTERCTSSLMAYLCEVKRLNRELSQAELLELGKRLVEKVQICHEENLHHLHLSPHKVYFTPHKELVLADLAIGPPGMETEFASVPIQCEIQSHIGYNPPELVQGIELPEAAVDVYQLGLILLQAATLLDVSTMERREAALQRVAYPWLRSLLEQTLLRGQSERPSLADFSREFAN